MTIAALARPEIRDLHAYQAAVLSADTIRLNSNEAAHAFGSIEIDGLNRYPEARPLQLQQAMADHYGVRPDNVLATRGSSEGIDLLIRTFCTPAQDAVLTTPPAFELYSIYASVQGASTRTVPLQVEQDFALDPDALLAACDPGVKLIFLCSPNNPVGTIIPAATIMPIVEARAGKSVVVVDEAYIEYSDIESLAPLVNRHDNLVVLRTLSKAHALAGARCGAVLAGSEIIGLLDGVLAPYALSSPVIAGALQALSEERLGHSRALVKKTVAERERVSRELAASAVVKKVWNSQGNFLFVQFRDVIQAQAALDSVGIAIRTFGDAGPVPDCARITIAAADSNDRLLTTLRSLD